MCSAAAGTRFGLAPSDSQGTSGWRRKGESEVASLVGARVSSEGDGETEAGAALAKAVGAVPITGRVDSNSPELGGGPAPSPGAFLHFGSSKGWRYSALILQLTGIYGDSLHTRVGR